MKNLSLKINIGANARDAIRTFTQVDKKVTSLSSHVSALGTKKITISRAQNDTFKALEDDIKSVDDRIDELKAKKITLKADIDIDKVKQLEADISDLNKDLKQKKTRKDIILQKISVTTDTKELKKLNKDLKDIDSKIESVSNQKIALSEELINARDANKKLNDEIKTTQQEIDELNSKRITLNDDLKKAQTEAKKTDKTFDKLNNTIKNVKFSSDIDKKLNDISTKWNKFSINPNKLKQFIPLEFKKPIFPKITFPKLPKLKINIEMENLENLAEVGEVFASVGEMVYELNKNLMNTNTLMKMWGGNSNVVLALGDNIKGIGLEAEEAQGLIENLHYKVMDAKVEMKKEGKLSDDFKEAFESLDFSKVDSRFSKLKTEEAKFALFAKMTNEERLELLIETATKAKDTQSALVAVDKILGGESKKIIEYLKMQGTTLDQLADKRKKLNFLDKAGESGLSSFSSSFGDLFTIFKTLTSQIWAFWWSNDGEDKRVDSISNKKQNNHYGGCEKRGIYYKCWVWYGFGYFGCGCR